MEALCYALLAGYPVMGAAVVALWRANQKAQADLLEGEKQRARELLALKKFLEERANP